VLGGKWNIKLVQFDNLYSHRGSLIREINLFCYYLFPFASPFQQL